MMDHLLVCGINIQVVVAHPVNAESIPQVRLLRSFNTAFGSVVVHRSLVLFFVSRHQVNR
jgi:hypothetical protein